MSLNTSYSRIWSIAYPIIIGSIAQNLINVTDTAFLGRVGEVELGAAGLGGMFYFVLIMLGLGFGTGTQIIISRRHGEGNAHMIGKTFDHSLYFMLGLTLFTFAILFFLSAPILRAVIGSDQIYLASVRFLDVRMYGIFFAFGQIIFRSFYIGISKTQVITWSTLVMALINIVLDYGLIFGKLGLPEMGLEGAALASNIAEFSAVLYLVVYVLYHKHHQKFSLFTFEKFDKSLFNRNFKLAYPIMLQNFLSLSTWFTFFLIVEKLGAQSLAISNIIRSVYIVLMIPIWGFASAANSMVSYLIGMRRQDIVFQLIRRIMILSTIGVGILVIITMIFPSALLQIYTNDIDLIHHSIPVLKVVSFSAIFLSTGFVLFNGVMGTGKTNVSFLIEMVVLPLYLLYVYILINHLGADVTLAWTSEIVYGLLLSTFSWIYLKKGNWSGLKLGKTKKLTINISDS